MNNCTEYINYSVIYLSQKFYENFLYVLHILSKLEVIEVLKIIYMVL